MLPELRDTIEDLSARAGLGRVPVPVLGAGAALLLAALAWGLLRAVPADAPVVEQAPARAEALPSPRAAEPTPAAEVVVHVVGAVRTPGVYRLPKGSRAEDAVRAAGGVLGSAELGGLNLARVVTDGEQLAVPAKGEAGAAPAAGAGSGAGTAGHGAGGKLDINRATVEDLDALPGIGPSTAAKIVKEREANGPYATVEDLMRVPGIGAKKLEGLKDLVTAG